MARSSSRFAMGSVNAAVFPVPVCARPMMSRPVRISGIASRWIGVGSVYPASVTALRRTADRPRSVEGRTRRRNRGAIGPVCFPCFALDVSWFSLAPQANGCRSGPARVIPCPSIRAPTVAGHPDGSPSRPSRYAEFRRWNAAFDGVHVLHSAFCIHHSLNHSAMRIPVFCSAWRSLLPALSGAQSPRLRVPATIDTLPNGLTLIVHEDHSVPRVVTNVWYPRRIRRRTPGSHRLRSPLRAPDVHGLRERAVSVVRHDARSRPARRTTARRPRTGRTTTRSVPPTRCRSCCGSKPIAWDGCCRRWTAPRSTPSATS